jgi:O-acetyl-ADP-ribose deacetylase (regulator of RNase III)
MLTLKAIKIAKFMSEETLAYTANIYWKNKKVGDCKNEGHGGCTMVWLHKASDAQKAEIQKYVMDHQTTKDWIKEFPPTANHTPTWEYYLEILVDDIANEKDEINDLKRICKGTVLFRVEGDPEGEFRTIKSAWDTKIQAHLAIKYGDKVVEVLNKTLAEKLAKQSSPWGGARCPSPPPKTPIEETPMPIKIEQVDITTLEVDAIVNAAKQTLLGGGGVDGAIHDAAGPELLAFCSILGGCAPGEAKITPGYKLPAKYIIHTVGPVWGENPDPIQAIRMDHLLAGCYRNSMELANALGLESIAFPAISTGIYNFPIRRATKIAQGTVMGCIAAGSSVKEATFCCFSDEDLETYQDVSRAMRDQIINRIMYTTG